MIFDREGSKFIYFRISHKRSNIWKSFSSQLEVTSQNLWMLKYQPRRVLSQFITHLHSYITFRQCRITAQILFILWVKFALASPNIINNTSKWCSGCVSTMYKVILINFFTACDVRCWGKRVRFHSSQV